MNDVTVAILAGGRSSRMGSDKAGVRLGEKTLGERALELALALSDDVVVLGHGRGMPDGVPHLDDDKPDQGPLGGIARLARRNNRGRVVVFPVDMPFLTAPLLGALVDALDARVECAHFSGSPLPCALARGALKRVPDHGAVQHAFASLRARALDVADADALENINTSEELRRSSQRPPFR